MFSFWASGNRVNDKPDETSDSILTHSYQQQQGPTPSPTPSLGPASPGLYPSKRKLHNPDDAGDFVADSPVSKRRKSVHNHSDTKFSEDLPILQHQDPLERARDEIRHQFGLEILLKHDELRLINQELAKCQVALEQLRRCHLIPYPVNCPTPEQMLNVSNGTGSALAPHMGDQLPAWAPPFGVVDGPYARHYSKWLIPDPAFDGMQPEWQFTAEAIRARNSFADGRSTRNSFSDATIIGKAGRPVRGNAGQKLQALSAGYPQPKDKAGPCVLKRADGQTVKLVCLDCHRENFSSTQGFINHCRIAHKRDFKSHEEAAVQSGQPVDSPDCGPVVPSPVDDKSVAATSTSASTSNLVHPFARSDMTEQQTYAALRSRISDSLSLYYQGKLQGVTSIPTSKPSKPKSKASATSLETPHLARFMQGRKLAVNLQDIVTDAKRKISIDDIALDEDSEDDYAETPDSGTPKVARTPAKSSITPMAGDTVPRPASSKGRSMMPSSSPTPLSTTVRSSGQTLLSDVDMDDEHLSPNTSMSNNAPSLVSDDGEYDDSDGSSVSEDSLDSDSVSDVAEITLDEDHEGRPLRRASGGAGPVRLRKDDTKHVTFISPVKNTTRRGRTRKV